MLQSVTIELPRPIFERLRIVAEQQAQSIPDTVDILIAQVETQSSLQNAITREMGALSSLPNEILLLVAQNPMPPTYQEELAELNDKAQRTGHLSKSERKQQANLSEYYQNAILRRAYCLEILRRRGYDISALLQMPFNPMIIQ